MNAAVVKYQGRVIGIRIGHRRFLVDALTDRAIRKAKAEAVTQ